MSEHIPVFCATDENYAPFAAIMMNTSSFIDFYVLDDGIKEKTKKLILKDLKKYPNKELHFVDMRKYDLNRFPNLAHLTTNAFSRYFIPDITPHLKKVIYLDVDIVMMGDVTELYYQDLKDKPIGAVPEDYLGNANKRLQKNCCPAYKNSSFYFNSGVLLLDLQKLIKIDFMNKCIKLTEELYHNLEWADQDVLNILFEDDYQKLDYRFNIPASREIYLYKKYPNERNISPLILHYSSDIKPWKHIGPKLFTHFNNILKTSVFYKRVIQEYRLQKKSKWLLFGFIPLFKTSKKNHAFDEKDTL